MNLSDSTTSLPKMIAEELAKDLSQLGMPGELNLSLTNLQGFHDHGYAITLIENGYNPVYFVHISLRGIVLSLYGLGEVLEFAWDLSDPDCLEVAKVISKHYPRQVNLAPPFTPNTNLLQSFLNIRPAPDTVHLIPIPGTSDDSR